jgi:rhomboid family GlyGly-CTERM serine protease
MNVAALAVLAFVLRPYLRPRDWVASGLTSALAIDAGLFWLHPAVDWYVGLSGVLHGFWAAAVASALLARRWDAAALGALLAGKLAYEAFAGPIPLTESVAAGPVVTAAHLWGAIGGACWPLAAFAIRGRQRPL